MTYRKAALLAAAGALATPGWTGSAHAEQFVGPRAEVTVGLDRLKFDLADYGVDDSIEAGGMSIGGAVGYDVPLGTGLVAGVEAGVSFSTADRTFDDGVTALSFDAKRDLELSGRLGSLVAPGTLLYGKAGYTKLRLGNELTAAGVTAASSADLHGYRLGLGLEHAISANAYLKSEYRYSNYEQDLTKNEVLAGFGIRF